MTCNHALDWWAYWRARYSRRTAARQATDQLAANTAEKAATAAGAPEATAAIRLRARCLVAGQLMFDRIRNDDYEKSIRKVLLGSDLDAPALAAT